MTSYRRGPQGSVTDICHHLELLDVPLHIVEMVTVGASTDMHGRMEGEVKYRGQSFATYKYCNGLDFPIFRFHGEYWKHYGRTKIYSPDENGVSNAEFRLYLGPHNNPSLHLHGKEASPELWDFTMSFISANHRDDPRYTLRQKAHCFFQGGSNDREGEWIYIEMYGEHAPEVIKYFSDNFKYKAEE